MAEELQKGQEIKDSATLLDSGPEIQKYLQILLKRKWLIITAFILVLGGVTVWTYSQTRIYKAVVSILVEKKAPQVLGSEVREVVDLSTGSLYRSREYMETQKKVITSLSISRKVVKKLNLHKNKRFWGERMPKKPSIIKAVNLLRSMLVPETIKYSNIIELSVFHRDPEIAAWLANTVARVFMDQNIEYKLASTSGAVKWLADQLDTLKNQIDNAELALYEFKKNNNVISVSFEAKQSLISRRIEKLNDALTDTRMKRMKLSAQLKQTTKVKDQDPLKVSIPIVTDNATVTALKEIYVAEYRKYVALKERYLERHPAVAEQKVKMVAAKKDLEQEVKNVLSTVEHRYREVLENENKLAAALQKAKDEAFVLNKREVSYRRLKRNQENTAKLYSMVMARMKESDLSAQLRVNNIRLLDNAEEPKIPVRPRVKLNLLIGVLFGFVVGIGLAFLVEALDTSIKSQEDVEEISGLVYLGLMPRIPGSQKSGRRPRSQPHLDLIVHRNPKSTVAESYRAIRTNLLFASPDQVMRHILVTSAGPREGKTTTAVSLGITMAQAGEQAGKKILLIDTDMRRPRLHKVFEVSGKVGITSMLLKDAKFDDVIKTTEVPDLYVLPCGPTPPNPAELCQSSRFLGLINELSQEFDRLILDSPPIMMVTDGVILSTLVDGTLLVARTSLTSRVALRECSRQVIDVGGNLVGCVLNDMDLEKKGYSYYRYRRYGYSKYGYYRSGYGYGKYGEKEEEAAS